MAAALARAAAAALDGLRDQLVALYELEAESSCASLARARRIIEVVLDPERRNSSAFVARHALRELDANERVKALQLLEMQRQAMLMYTSCGWFFSEVSGLETVQILKYAARALQLAREGCGADLEVPFKAALERAPSNIPARTDARRVYEQEVQPSIASLDTVAAHYAIAGLVEDFPGAHASSARGPDQLPRREDVGTAALSLARIEVRSLITQEQIDLATCVLHFSGPISAAASGRTRRNGSTQRGPPLRVVQPAVARAGGPRDRPRIPRAEYTLRDLFLDERREVAGGSCGRRWLGTRATTCRSTTSTGG